MGNRPEEHENLARSPGERLAEIPWLPLILWALVITAAAFYAPRLGDVMRDDAPKVPGSESDIAQAIVAQEFTQANTQELVAVFTSPTQEVTEPGYKQNVVAVLTEMLKVVGVQQTRSYWDTHEPSMLGRDKRSTFAMVKVRGGRTDLRQRVVPALRRIAAKAPAGIKVHVTGDVAIGKDLADAGHQTVKEAERIVIPVVLVVLLLVFRSLVAALIPLGLGLISVTLARAVIYVYALYYPVQSLASTMISMIGMGVGVDYALFMVTRYRDELAAGASHSEALQRTQLTSGQSIIFSGLTVLVSVASLYLVNNPIIRVMAVAMALVVLVAVLVATTLLPAVLNVLGPRVDALTIPLPRLRRATEGEGFWHKWAMGVMRHPWMYTSVAALPLVLVSYPALHMQTGWPNLSQLPQNADSRQGFHILQNQFAAGLAGRIEILAKVKNGTVVDDANFSKLYNIATVLKEDPSVDSVLSFVSFAPGWDLKRYQDLYVGGPAKLIATPVQLGYGAAQLNQAVGALEEIRRGISAAATQLPELGKGAVDASKGVAGLNASLQRARDTIAQVSVGLSKGVGDMQALSSGLATVNGLLNQSTKELESMPFQAKLDPHYLAAYSSLATARGIVTGAITGRSLPEATSEGATALAQAASALDQLNSQLGVLQAGVQQLVGGLTAGSATPTEAVAGLANVTSGLNQVIVGVRKAAGQLQQVGTEAAAANLPIALGSGGFGLRLAMAAGGSLAAEALPSLVNIDRGATIARFVVVPKTGPDTKETAEFIRRLRTVVLPQATADLAGVWVGGVPAQIVDFNDQLRWALPRIMGLVLGITFLVLLLLLRSLVLPLKAILMNTLSVTAAYGVLVLVFQHGHLAKLLGFTPLGYVESPVMVVLFAVLFGLSMDYEVFMLTRIKELYTISRDNTQAVAEGLERTAGVISGAALIMVFVFGAFVATGLITAKEFGFGLAVAVLLDATLLRILMVPAFMRLAGQWNWWAPAWLLRILPEVKLRE